VTHYNYCSLVCTAYKYRLHIHLDRNQSLLIPPLNVQHIQTGLKCTVSGVLLLLDSCAYAGLLNTRGRYDQAEGGTTEITAACGFENFAPGSGTTSFTNALIEKLKRHAKRGDVFSAASLHQQVVEQEEEGATSLG
jgi:hypothetical protein